MPTNEETISISPCPICNSSHTYKLQVERSMVFKMMTGLSFSEGSTKVKFTRLFRCPGKGQDFQATIVLTETSSSRIDSVTVSRVAGNDE